MRYSIGLMASVAVVAIALTAAPAVAKQAGKAPGVNAFDKAAAAGAGLGKLPAAGLGGAKLPGPPLNLKGAGVATSFSPGIGGVPPHPGGVGELGRTLDGARDGRADILEQAIEAADLMRTFKELEFDWSLYPELGGMPGEGAQGLPGDLTDPKVTSPEGNIRTEVPDFDELFGLAAPGQGNNQAYDDPSNLAAGVDGRTRPGANRQRGSITPGQSPDPARLLGRQGVGWRSAGRA